MILGIDEVGRGAWAGPLVVGAAVLKVAIDGLTDSKLLSKKRREELYEEIMSSGAAVGLGWVKPIEIDEIGLGPALKLATRRAIENVQQQKQEFHEIIIDGTINFLAGTALESHVTTIKKADLLIPSVSAASIVAKVARDRYMCEQDEQYPEYNFSTHVGYGTLTHRNAIAKHGITPLHRTSIAPLAAYKVNTPARAVSHDSTTKRIGDAGEAAAAAHLEALGYQIIDQNWKTKFCEIDIVAGKDLAIYFFEVKHRKNVSRGGGLAAITQKKLRKMSRAAEAYSTYKKFTNDLQLGVISTVGEQPTVETYLLLE